MYEKNICDICFEKGVCPHHSPQCNKTGGFFVYGTAPGKEARQPPRKETNVANTDKIKKIWRAIALGLAALLVAGGALWFVQSRLALRGAPAMEEYAVVLPTDDVAKGTHTWMEGYLDALTRSTPWAGRKLQAYWVGEPIVMGTTDEPWVRYIFTVTPAPGHEAEFADWGAPSSQDDSLLCDWTIRMRTAPVAGGYEFRFGGRQHYEALQTKAPAPYTYEFTSTACFVRYDGDTRREVPVPREELLRSFDDFERREEDTLPEGSYLITDEMTAFLYGGTNEIPLRMVYSTDKGATWQLATVADTGYGMRQRFVFFPSATTGYVVVSGDCTMHQELTQIFKTTDGGANWQHTGNGPVTRLLQGASFVNPGVGFLCYPPATIQNGSHTRTELQLYRTGDGGASFTQLSLPLPPVADGYDRDTWKKVFVQPTPPLLGGRPPRHAGDAGQGRRLRRPPRGGKIPLVRRGPHVGIQRGGAPPRPGAGRRVAVCAIKKAGMQARGPCIPALYRSRRKMGKCYWFAFLYCWGESPNSLMKAR